MDIARVFIILCCLSLLIIQCKTESFLRELEKKSKSDNGIILSKSITGKSTRVLFVAGLEGTGHHAIRSLLTPCTLPEGLCQSDEELSDALMRQISNGVTDSQGMPIVDEVNVIGLFGSNTTMYSPVRYAKFVHEKFRILSESEVSKLYLLGIVEGRAGMMSYPNFRSKHRYLDHPDIHLLSLLAETASTDLRIIVLQRPAIDTYWSVRNRGWDDELQLSIMIDQASLLYNQLSMIDPAFYICIPYELMGSMTDNEIDKIIDFIHPSLSSLRNHMKETIHYNSTNKATRDGLDSASRFKLWQLQLRLDMINGLCIQKKRHGIEKKESI